MAATAVDMPGSSTIHLLKNSTAATGQNSTNSYDKQIVFPEKRADLDSTYPRCPFCLSVFGKYTTDTSWAHQCFKGCRAPGVGGGGGGYSHI